MTRIARPTIAFGSFLFCALVIQAGAQSSSSTTPPLSGIFAVAEKPVSPRDTAVTLKPLRLTGAPRSYQVVSIPVPDALTDASWLEAVIVAKEEFAVLGPHTRMIDVRGGQKKVGLTIGIPAGALAGRFVAAEVRFLASRSSTVVVPVEVDVSLVRSIVLRRAAEPLNAQAGSDVILPFEIANSGNALERVNTELQLPTGWSTREIHQTALAIAPGEVVKRRVRLKIPPLSSTGSSFVHVALLVDKDTLAAETMTIEVFNSSSVGRQAGPLVTSAYSHAVDENGRANQLVTFTADGALYDSVRIDARVSQGSVLGGAAGNAFAHLGSFQSAASVLLSAPSGQLSLGNTGTSFSELTGLYPYGQGALLQLRRPDWNLQTLGALSMPAVGSTERKPMLGMRAEHQLGVAQLSASISHLADAGPAPRKLDAFGMGVTVPAFAGTTFKSEIAERRFQSGYGLGWSTSLVRIEGPSNEELRATHAPGGGDAFARATNELVANASEQLSSRVSISGSAWRTTDATSVFSGLKSNGFSLRPQYRVHGATTVAIEARSYLFDATSRPTQSGGGGAFGSREQQLGIGLSTYLRQYYLNSTAYLGNVTRTVAPVGQSTISDRTPRNYWTTNAGWTGVGGGLEVQMRIEQTRDRGGFVNQQSVFGIHGEQVVLPWLGGIRGEGELQRVNGFGEERSSIARAGLAVPILSGFALGVDAERNSIFHSAGGKVPWVLGIRFEHSLMVPMLRTPGTSGYVYEDLNGNQRRDNGEPGIGGAIVRRGGETAVADEWGKYRVGGDARQPVAVDEASLPDGWSSNGASHGDLGVSLSTSTEVELVVAPRSGISAVQVDLSKARVIARDSAGREWGAIMTGPTTATFQSLPVGTYFLDFDLSELSEPLIPRGPIPQLIVSGKESKSITITLDPRPIRMWNGGSKSSGQKKDTTSGSTDKKGGS